jgi:inosine/xanthosine triphosphate pyrophosphatase family protein
MMNRRYRYFQERWLFSESSFNGYKLTTSNENKLKEYQRYLPDLVMGQGSDISEVNSDDITVAIYKAMDNGPMTISEDTSLEVDGHDVGVNIRWLLNNLPKMIGRKSIWKVLIGKNDGEYIEIFEGVVSGVIVEPIGDGFAFDPYFLVDGIGQTLGQLKSSENIPEVEYSARAIAVSNLKNDNYIKKVALDSIPEWDGEYQH